jgi:hypothetical protein
MVRRVRTPKKRFGRLEKITDLYYINNIRVIRIDPYFLSKFYPKQNLPSVGNQTDNNQNG